VTVRKAQYATAFAVLAVATIAAIVSYAHVESVALGHGYTLATARLLPLSVDGLVIAASMALGTGTRPALARTGLVLGILATVAANVVYGAHYGITGAVVNSWPAASFIVASELLLGMVRTRTADVPDAVVQEVTESVSATVLQEVTHEAAVDVSAHVPEIAVNAVPASTVYPVPVTVPRTVAARPAQAQATRAKRLPDPARLFAAELAAGRAPSLRAIKEKMHVGTPAAQEIRARLVAIMETPQAA
jgi:hypothetical protein